MKYKLIKTFPGSPVLGAIFGYYRDDTHMYYLWKAVESFPEFFAPFLFTTEDDLDVYVGDKLWFAHDVSTKEPRYVIEAYTVSNGFSITKRLFTSYENAQQWIDSQRKPIWKTEDGVDVFDGDTVSWVIFSVLNNQWEYSFDLKTIAAHLCLLRDRPETYRVFRDRDKMNTWIKEQNRVKFEVGEWLYFDSGLSKTLFRFLKIVDNEYITTEGYQIMNYGTVYIYGESNALWDTKENITKATPAQIEETLAKIAVHKGFKEGVKFKSPTGSDTVFICGSSFKYEFEDILYSKDNRGEYLSGCIYYDRKWAEIVEDVTEYIEATKNYSNYFMPGKIYKVLDSKDKSSVKLICNVDTIGTRKAGSNLYVDSRLDNWKPSTKEAYDAQNIVPETKGEWVAYKTPGIEGTLNIKFIGEVTGVIINDKTVKINYKV